MYDLLQRIEETVNLGECIVDVKAHPHCAGYAHSIELWEGSELAGGLYGVALGRAFFGESMFSGVTDASKIVMVYLCELLARHGFAFLDCQVFNPHLASMGAVEVPRARFLRELEDAVSAPAPARAWREPAVTCDCLEHAA